ncbi:hypothetical protein [Shewanella benthica]|uniref:hypothetical protein n=1 Tax=Shewanella benthica TaxID=43661 RepID=UPI0002D3BD27|nr:hypothetical protein [Shewanella benthica]
MAWYSKDVMPWKHGHVECIALATDAAIKGKRQAVHEVMNYIHQAGEDIEFADENFSRHDLAAMSQAQLNR